MQGDTIVWDIDRLKRKEDENADFKEDSAVLVKETTRSFTTHTALAISSRCSTSATIASVANQHIQ